MARASLAILAGLVLVSVIAVLPSSVGAFPPKTGSIAVGSKAPDFLLKNMEGETVELAKMLEEGAVLLDFWALWCKPCLRALPGTEKIHQEFSKKGLTVLTVNVDSPRSTSKVRSYVKSKGYEFEVLLDPNGKLMRSYHFRSIPQLFLVARDGTIAFSQIGYAPAHEKRLRAEVEALLFPQPEETEEGSGPAEG